ncbi:MAG: hypothetical protein D6743_12850 [Calditrichaeota bacterium]|nr:MAG: hypothetical protein D6743_12850 [Calditrichota bacterium]
MTFFIVAGVLFLFFSALFFFAPGVIIRLSEIGNRLVFTDHGSVAHRKLSGAVLLIMSLVMFYLGVRL